MTAPESLSGPVPPAVPATYSDACTEDAEAGSVDVGASGEGQPAAAEPGFPETPIGDWLRDHWASVRAGRDEAARLAGGLGGGTP